MNNKSLILLKLLILACITFNFIPVIHTLSYSKSWSFERGDALKIEINPEYTAFQPGKNYSFSVVLSPLSFMLNQDKFSNISVQLRYKIYDSTIYSSILGKYEFDSQSASVTKQVSLSIPDGKNLNATGQSSGSFEYKLDYNIDLTNGSISYETTHWQIISIVDVTFGTTQNNFFLGAFVVIILVVVISIAFRYRKSHENISHDEIESIAQEKDHKNELN